MVELSLKKKKAGHFQKDKQIGVTAEGIVHAKGQRYESSQNSGVTG